ncbi:hypothetical protein TNCV_4972581 [Trichonephila clavipes]|nr:hypothetical protein TNCV_4972581 [Trichonephila clavipes]
MHYHSHLSCNRPNSRMQHPMNTELADMHLTYGLEEGNARTPERFSYERIPHRHAQSEVAIYVNMDNNYVVIDIVKAGHER